MDLVPRTSESVTMVTLLLLLLANLPARHAAVVNEMSIDAQQTLLDLKLRLQIDHSIGTPVPIYRTDMSHEYVAYWQIELGKDFVLISAGPKTGDHDLVHQGPTPTFTSHVQQDASQQQSTCSRFYLLSPGGEMMCRNHEGRIVGSNIPKKTIQQQDGAGNRSRVDDIQTFHEFLESQLPKLKQEWEQHRQTVNGNNEDYNDDEEEENADHQAPLTELDVYPLRPGKQVKVAVGDATRLDEITLIYLPTGNASSEESTKVQVQICALISGCQQRDTKSTINIDTVQTEPNTREAFIVLEMSEKSQTLLNGKDVIFSLVFNYEDGQKVERYFGVYTVSHRQKRGWQYKPWSTSTYHSIAYESTFPHYNQFKSGKCQVGCGPVAWAMVFGYLDRRASNAKYANSGSKYLYRNGPDGTTGSESEVAPYRLSDTRIRGYIDKLNDELGTFCLFGSGATLAKHMPKAEGFFRRMQKGGSPDVVEKRWWLTVLGRYSSKVESWARARVREGWPVIIGWRNHWLGGWHYPVVTQYRSKTRRKRLCWRFWGRNRCFRWKSETSYEMYLHMGWGGSQDGWKAMDAYYAVYARY